jgi:uncharacterized protein (TIGR03437 family)
MGIPLSIALLAIPAAAQLPSNASLQGAYNVRYLGVLTDPADSAVSFSGTITFDGNGGFTVTGQGASAATSSHSLTFLTSGTYGVLSSGSLYMSNPFDPATSDQTHLYGGLGSNGAIVASSTDTLYCDLFVAIPEATGASSATLSGTYQVASLEFLNADFTQTRDTFFSMSADGKGSLGNVTVKGTAQDLGSAAAVQTSTSATYTVTANGTGTLTLPAPGGQSAANTLLSGNKVLYASSDGSFFIAGSTSGYDMIIGAKAAPGGTLSGIYFTAYLQNYAAGTSYDGIYSTQGAINELSPQNTEFAHQRINPDGYASYDFTFSDTFGFAADGTASYSDSFYAVCAGGNIAIGAGNSTTYQLVLYLKAPAMSGSGVFLNPQGIVNAANNAPFTAQVAPGEMVTLYGTGLSTQTTTASYLPFPTTLGGVQVTMAPGTSAAIAVPICAVSPTQISVVVPFNMPTDGTFLTFQVNYNGATSNQALVYSGNTSPGVFTVPPGGIGNGAILHADYSLVSSASPAKAGETVQIFLTGLGVVNSAVAAGAAGPSSPLATVVNPVDAYIDGTAATVMYQGLAPTLGGLYQLNVTIPSGLSTGNQPLEISTYDGDNIQATIPIGK